MLGKRYTYSVTAGLIIMDELAFLKDLEKKGITFAASYGAESGTSTLSLTPEEALLFSNEPVQVIANKCNVTISDYHNWVNEEYNVQCSANTAKGKRCKNIVSGGHMVSLEKWAKLTGQYCELHERSKLNHRR